MHDANYYQVFIFKLLLDVWKVCCVARNIKSAFCLAVCLLAHAPKTFSVSQCVFDIVLMKLHKIHCQMS